jgi:hypothetical protein
VEECLGRFDMQLKGGIVVLTELFLSCFRAKGLMRGGNCYYSANGEQLLASAAWISFAADMDNLALIWRSSYTQSRVIIMHVKKKAQCEY